MCKLCDKRGQSKCPTHSLTPEQLSERNAKAAATFRRRDKRAFIKQRQEAGKLGFEATMEKYGREFVLKAVQDYQSANPSSYEQQLARILDSLDIAYERQVIIEGLVVDFLIAEWLVIEIDGHRFKPSFGEEEARGVPEDRINALREMGYGAICLDSRLGEDEWERIVRQQYKDGRYDPTKLEF